MDRVKFTKKQLRALAQIEDRANEYFDEECSENPYFYLESDRDRYVRCAVLGILRSIVKTGVFYVS